MGMARPFQQSAKKENIIGFIIDRDNQSRRGFGHGLGLCHSDTGFNAGRMGKIPFVGPEFRSRLDGADGVS